VTFTYNMNQSQLESLLANVGAKTKSEVETALNLANLGSAHILTTFVDSGAPHSFNSSTSGYSNFTSSGQLLIADVLDSRGVGNNSVSVTDSAGGNYFAMGTFADTLYVDNQSANVDTIFGDANGSGSAAAETIEMGAGDFKVYAGDNSSVMAGSGAATVYTGVGHDTVTLTSGDDVVYGWNNDGSGNRGVGGYNTINLGSGNSTVYLGQHSDVEGAGTSGGVTRVFGAFDASGSGAVSTAADTIVANANDMYITLGMGSASVTGGSGRMFLYNGTGKETISLGSGNSTIDLINSGDSSITGGTGYETINFWVDKGDATIHGGAHTTVNVVDVVSGVGGNSAVVTNADGTTTYNFKTTSLTVDSSVTLTYSNAATTSDFNTFAHGAPSSDVAYASGGSSISGDSVAVDGVAQIVGSYSSSVLATPVDTIVGGQSDMFVTLEQGATSLTGGSGRLFLYNGTGSETVQLGSGNSTIDLNNTGSSSITGGTGHETINFWVDTGSATIHGGADTTVNVVDAPSGVGGSGSVGGNADGTTTYYFKNTTLTVDSSVHVTHQGTANTSDFTTFKNS